MASESEVRTWKCHQCPAIKGERNHWWIFFRGRLTGSDIPVLQVRPFSLEQPPGDAETAVCHNPACFNLEARAWREAVGGQR